MIELLCKQIIMDLLKICVSKKLYYIESNSSSRQAIEWLAQLGVCLIIVSIALLRLHSQKYRKAAHATAANNYSIIAQAGVIVVIFVLC